jgi:plasmid stabilization system protein ParE
MKVVFTAAAQNDLREIGEWLAEHYPAVAPHVERRIRDIVARIGRWPESGPRSAGRAGSRRRGAIPTRFSTVSAPTLSKFLHIHHAARRPWDERP